MRTSIVSIVAAIAALTFSMPVAAQSDAAAPDAAVKPPSSTGGTSSTTPLVDNPASGSTKSSNAERDDRVGSTMAECMSNWDESSHMTKGEWRRSCSSLLADPTRD